MNQLAIDFDAPAPVYTVAQARAVGAEAGGRAADRAERADEGFGERAAAFIRGYLAQHGASSGEVVTDAAKVAGIRPPDDRAFGPIYAALARRGQIVAVGFCVRRKGRGTAGGRVWRLA